MKDGTIKILLVDDEPDILEFMEYNLKKEGYRPTVRGMARKLLILL